MQSAAELPTMIALCFRCQARFAGPEPASCPGCGGAVILRMDALARAQSIVEMPDAGDGEASDDGSGPSFLPGVHIKLAPRARQQLARAGEGAAAPLQGGGTSVHAAGARREGGLALKLVSMAALLATFAFFLQAAH